MKTFILYIPLLVILACGAALSQPPQPEQPYDEWAESPTIDLGECGVFPAVRVTIDGRELENRGAVHRGRTFLPARETLERIGGTVTWSGQQRAFYGQFPEQDTTFRVTVGSRTAHVYEYDAAAAFGAGRLRETFQLDAAPMHCEGRVFAPIRAAVESVGGNVAYNAETRMVHITTPSEVAERLAEVSQ